MIPQIIVIVFIEDAFRSASGLKAPAAILTKCRRSADGLAAVAALLYFAAVANVY